MSQQKPIPPLFRITNVATTRNSDPETSHEAADLMNQGDNLKNQQLQVLAGINKHSGRTPKDIGIEMAHERTGLSREQIREVMAIVGQYHRRPAELLSQKLITREEDGRVFINDKGLIYLERH